MGKTSTNRKTKLPLAQRKSEEVVDNESESLL